MNTTILTGDLISAMCARAKLIHKERGDPLDLPSQAREGIYEMRAAMFLPFVEGKDVLELGCGYGYDAFLFSKRAKMVIGLDVNKNATEKASTRFDHISNLFFVADDALNFLNNGRKFDIIVLFESLEHFTAEEQLVLIKTLWETLKPNGQLFLSTPNGKCVPFYRKNPYHKKELSVEELKMLLSGHFRIETIKGQVSIMWFFLPLPWLLVEKLWLRLGIYTRMCRLRNSHRTSRTIIIRAARK